MRFDVSIPSDTNAGQEVQERIIALMAERNFSQKDCWSVRLALEEAIVNAIRHGNQRDPSKMVQILCDLSEDRVFLEIRDEGPGFRLEDVPDPTADENLEKPSGRGLMLMRSFMTRVEIVGKGNCVILEKTRTVE